MKHLFIVNPVAGGKDSTETVRQQVEAAFRTRAGEYEIYVTKAPMDAAEKIRAEAAVCDHLRVYACGGDGTFNECVNGAALLENVAAAPFPTGTGNDFCRMFGAEKDCFRDLEALLDGWEHPIDLIDCNGRWCDNICSVGIDARVGTDVHKYSKIPLFGGFGSYALSLIVNIFKGISSGMHIRCGDFTADGPQTLICACNGRYYGGGFNPSPDAKLDDGILEIFVVPRVSLFTLARCIGPYAAGKADRFPKVIRHLRGTQLHIDFDEENVVNIDGEAVFAKSVDMKLVPRAMRLIVPAGMHFFDNPV